MKNIYLYSLYIDDITYIDNILKTHFLNDINIMHNICNYADKKYTDTSEFQLSEIYDDKKQINVYYNIPDDININASIYLNNIIKIYEMDDVQAVYEQTLVFLKYSKYIDIYKIYINEKENINIISTLKNILKHINNKT